MVGKWTRYAVPVMGTLIGLATLVASFSVHQIDTTLLSETKMRSGDQSHWKDPDLDDSNWQTYGEWQRANGPFQGNLWLRQSLELTDDPERNMFVLVAVGSSEVYFDGELIGRNGMVGTSPDNEVPGSLVYVCTIPSHLLGQGTHQVALRFSNHHGIGRFYLLGGGVGSVEDVLSFTRRSMFPFVFLSAFLVVAVYFLVLYLINRRETAFLVFALLCSATSLLLFVESMRAIGYPYHWHGYRLLSVLTITGLLSALVPLFFILRHGLSRRWLWGIPFALGIGVAMFHRSLDHASFGLLTGAFLYAQLVVCTAYWRGKADAWLGMVGVSQGLIAIAITGMWFMERWLFVSFTLLIVLILISLGLQIKRQRLQFQEAQLRSARLQIELLKKHMQPHFMLNTLTAVMEWLEREPAEGVRFIGLLAEEMKTLNRMSGENLVSLTEELRLCHHHLDILAYRTGERYPFETVHENPDLQIPPALILTLVENGVSYAHDEGSLSFALRQWVNEQGQIMLQFKAMGVDIAVGKAEEGTGSRYLKARLQESFPDRWQITSSGSEQTWTTQVEIEGTA